MILCMNVAKERSREEEENVMITTQEGIEVCDTFVFFELIIELERLDQADELEASVLAELLAGTEMPQETVLEALQWAQGVVKTETVQEQIGYMIARLGG